MDAEIGRFSLGLTEPTVTIQNFKLYNPPDFGGTPFLDIREIHVEYDRAALARHEIHLTLLRFNLGELDIVKNEAGRTNIFSLGVTWPSKKSGGGKSAADFKKQTGFEFKSIDVLNVSVGTVKFIDLKDQRHNRTQKIGLENCVMKNVKSPGRSGRAGGARRVARRRFFWIVGQPAQARRSEIERPDKLEQCRIPEAIRISLRSTGVPPASLDYSSDNSPAAGIGRRSPGLANPVSRQKPPAIFTFSARGFFSNFIACIVNPSKPPPASS